MRKTNIDLRSVVNNHANYLLEPRKLKTVLLGKYPGKEHKRDINVIIMILESGLIGGLSEKKSVSSDYIEHLASRLEEYYGITPEYSKPCFMSWFDVWKISAASAPEEMQEDGGQTACPAENSSDILQPQQVDLEKQGIPDDYELELRPQGWIIKKFIGFEEINSTVPNMVGEKAIVGIGEEAYKGCACIKNISISTGIQFIEKGAFENCKELQTVEFPISLVTIGDKAFMSTKISSVTMSQNIKTIGEWAFAYCRNLQEVNSSEELTDIGDRAFYGCEKLANFRFQNSLKRIGSSAFKSCAFTEVHIPNGTTYIGHKAFASCYKLVSIYIPTSVEHIEGTSPGGGILGYSSKATVYCSPGSAALEHARKNGYSYKRM